MMSKKYQFVVFIVFGILVVSANIFLNQPRHTQFDNVQVIKTKCRIDLAPCELTDEANTFKVTVQGEIKPLKKFSVKLTDKNGLLETANVKLSMKDMDMGKNIFSFEKVQQDLWNADVIIPVCTTGRRDWEMELELSSKAKTQKFLMYLAL